MNNPWDFGIYGLVVDNTIVYIGYTHACFQFRFNAHNDIEAQDNPFLKQLIRDKVEFRLQPLITFRRELKDMVTKEELLILEGRLIKEYKPKFNIQIPKDKTIYFSNKKV